MVSSEIITVGNMKNGLQRQNLDILNFCFKIRYTHLEESSLLETSVATLTKLGTSLEELGRALRLRKLL